LLCVIHSFCKKEDHNKENLFNSLNYDVAAKKRKKDLLNNKAKIQCKMSGHFINKTFFRKRMENASDPFFSVQCISLPNYLKGLCAHV